MTAILTLIAGLFISHISEAKLRTYFSGAGLAAGVSFAIGYFHSGMSSRPGGNKNDSGVVDGSSDTPGSGDIDLERVGARERRNSANPQPGSSQQPNGTVGTNASVSNFGLTTDSESSGD